MIARTALLAGLMLGASPAASADDVDCTQATSTMEIDICMSREYEQADAELNTTYRDMRGQLRRWEDGGNCHACRGMTEALVQAQRHWIDFRDRDCDAAYALAADGSGRNQARLDCLIEHTRARTRQLTDRFDIGN
ncbi:lysozyme inhibitor LprI family protein [Marilutibacter alkalisoli]|uniref:DUF1311 domain-containing protein n=1 Tax=Marilutibacter alkalisoli TaxID=2591633 RepID=A0A514BNV4_9GAMM|nr:lysozyme inhibitor LprI family protein [Lysobacter alkalisoli]QDH69066.1 DUF1311 domain-containing protein [Lysobacter alkalisoli]